MNDRIVLSEYPKSGGSWIVSLLGEVLQVPMRDIYVNPGFSLFDIRKHPWYFQATQCDFPEGAIVKSHELPGSPLIKFEARYIHLMRDGRDVVVSRWFFDKDFCVKNGITESFDEAFDDYVVRVAQEWANYVRAWRSQVVVTVRYEDFLVDPVASLRKLVLDISGRDYDDACLAAALKKYSKSNFSAMLGVAFKHNTFVRKGVRGDWRNHFSRRNIDDFLLVAGDVLVELGYESSKSWGV